MEMPGELKAAMDRVLSLEQLELYDSLTHLLTLHNYNTHLHAAHIYASEEEKAGETEEEELQTVTEKHRADEVDALHDTLLNHQLVRQSFQQAALKIQMQEAVTESLAKVDLTDHVENFPVTKNLIDNVWENAQSCSELVGLLEEKRRLDTDILQQRLKYTNLVNNITNKWKAFENLSLPYGTHSPKVQQQTKKLCERENKLQLLVSMLQGLVCSSGIHWGKHQYYITLLKMCDSIIRNSSSEEQDQYISELPQLRENMLQLEKDQDIREHKDTIKKFFKRDPKKKQ